MRLGIIDNRARKITDTLHYKGNNGYGPGTITAVTLGWFKVLQLDLQLDLNLNLNSGKLNEVEVEVGVAFETTS